MAVYVTICENWDLEEAKPPQNKQTEKLAPLKYNQIL